jgi:predicted transcriptional regulator
MSSITVSLSDEQLLKLQETAARFGLSPEDLVRVSLEDLLARPEEDFRTAVEYVLNKNDELYRRLA